LKASKSFVKKRRIVKVDVTDSQKLRPSASACRADDWHGA
jgi:hypothetical protein